MAKQLAAQAKARDGQTARWWLVENETKLQENISASMLDLQLSTTPDDYLHDDSFRSGENPETFTNRLMAEFDKEMLDTRYVPPNKEAEEAWKARTAEMRGTFRRRAMAYEAELRSKAQLTGLNNAVDGMAHLAYNGTASVDELLNRIDTLTNDPSEDGYAGLIKASDMLGIQESFKNRIVHQSVLGFIQRDPLSAFATMRGKTGVIGDKELNKALKFLTAEQKVSLTRQAKQASIIVHEEELFDLGQKIEQHVVSLENGGEGLQELNSEKGVANAYISVYGGDYGKIKLDLIPELGSTMELARTRAEEAIRVARFTGTLVNSFPLLQNKDLTSNLRDLEDLINTPAEELSTDALRNSVFDLPPDVGTGLTNDEISKAVKAALPVIYSKLQLRANDFAEFALREPGIQGLDMGPERFSKTRAFGQALGFDYVPLLTNQERAQVLAEARSINDPELAGAYIKNLEEQHGEDFEDIYRQLTTGPGALEFHWQVMGALYGTNAASMFGSAATADRAALVETLKGRGENESIAQVEQRVFEAFGEIANKFTGGMPQNIDTRNSMMDTFVKATIIQMNTTEGLQSDVAVQKVLGTFTQEIYFPTSPRLAYYMLPQHGANGAVVDDMLMDALDDGDNVSALIEQYGILVPGSAVPQVNADLDFRRERYASIIAEQGVWSISAEGDGVYLTLPVNAGPKTSHTGGGVMQPVYVEEDGVRKPFELKFHEIGDLDITRSKKFKPHGRIGLGG